MTVLDESNKGAPGVPYYTPEQSPPAGTALDPETAPTLYKPIKIRSVELHNRLVVSPMCMYSADDGHLSDFHLVHLGQFALHGAALTIVEATAVEARGRISPQDSGIWKDSQIPILRRITDFAHSQGTKAGIQLAHAGRKASTLAPWIGGTVKKSVAEERVGGWPNDVVAPSSIPFDEGWAVPKALTVEDIQDLVKKWVQAAERAIKAGFDVIEIHAAHGYLNTEFMSPMTNKRTDQYGGSFENRIRLLKEIVLGVRAVIPSDMPLWLRISATEWMEWTNEPSWDINESIRLAKLVPDWGVDVLDVSSAGNNPKQRIKRDIRFQTDLASQIREAVRAEGKQLLIGAVGSISEAEMARSLVQEGGSSKASNGDSTIEVNVDDAIVAHADFVLAARQFLREPQWPLSLAQELNVPVQWPHQYARAPKPPVKL